MQPAKGYKEQRLAHFNFSYLLLETAAHIGSLGRQFSLSSVFYLNNTCSCCSNPCICLVFSLLAFSLQSAIWDHLGQSTALMLLITPLLRFLFLLIFLIVNNLS